MKKFPTLYKLTNSGKIQEWNICCFVQDGKGIYEIVHGQQNGKKQTTQTVVKKGKNIGKKNETSVEQQVEAEALSLWNKKRDRSGYTESIPDSKPLRPMLAKDFWKEHSKIPWPRAFVQPKLDGVRLLARIEAGEVTLISRQGKTYTSCEHIREALRGLPDMILDGELFTKGMAFQDIISCVKRDVDKEDTKKIQYHVYDLVDTKLKFAERSRKIHSLKLSAPIKIVETQTCGSMDEATRWHKEFEKDGYEGAMIRGADSLYKINGRSDGLLKLKSFLDKEFEIVGVEEGKGKFAGMGIFVCQTEEQYRFNVTPAATEEQKRQIWNNRDSYIGKMLTVQYFELTTSEKPVPRFPVGKIIRDYENP